MRLAEAVLMLGLVAAFTGMGVIVLIWVGQ